MVMGAFRSRGAARKAGSLTALFSEIAALKASRQQL